MAAKKQKLVDLSSDEKKRVRKITLITVAGVAMVCIILVGCFACTQDSGQPTVEMTPEQKVQYWNARIMDVNWAPQTDSSNDGVLKGMYMARDARTTLDSTVGKMIVYFLISEGVYFSSAEIVLENDEGSLLFANDEVWHVRFSEKNEVLFMTIRDSDNKTVYYQQK